jgi:hypothetical protein
MLVSLSLKTQLSKRESYLLTCVELNKQMTGMSRRDFVRVNAAAAFMAGKDPAARKPNIVLILADDLGFGDVHFLNPQRGRLPTPNIEPVHAALHASQLWLCHGVYRQMASWLELAA